MKFIEKIIYITYPTTKERKKKMIYNSRNYSILLNNTHALAIRNRATTVEIILYYLTLVRDRQPLRSTTVEIILYYLTLKKSGIKTDIYNSRNYSILLNSKFVYLHNFLEPSNFIFIILYNICTIYVK